MIRERLPGARRSPVPPPPPEGSLPSRPSRLPLSPRAPRDEAQRLVRHLAGASPQDLAEPLAGLLELGEPALDAVSRAFPGALWPAAFAVPGQPFMARSPVAAALLAFGDAAWAHVEWLMEAPEAHVRAEATRLLGELRRQELLVALEPRLSDADAEVREAAGEALRRMPGSPARAALVAGLVRRLSAPTPEDRRRAVEVLAAVREPSAVGALVGLLGERDRGLARRAHEALRLVTGHDFGNLRDGWSRWLSTHGSRSRESWLRAGAQDRREEVAQLAQAELAALLEQR